MTPSLRTTIPLEEFDYGILMSALSSLVNPRQKVTSLLKQGHIIRVKKGLYVWGEAWRKRPVQMEILANLIYGPSIVSGEWALSHHGLIPERVTAVTSTGPKPPKDFHTPLGLFRYERVPMEYHSLGMRRIKIGNTGFLIASAERALCDRLLSIPGLYRPSLSQMGSLLEDDLRIEKDALVRLDVNMILALAQATRSPRLVQLHACLKQFGDKE
jgi:hypothetical protein